MGLRIATVILFFLWGTCCAIAHDSHVTHARDWLAADGTRYQIALINGDGILGPDPVRPIVLNAEGLVVAVGPLASVAVTVCESANRCRVLSQGDAFVRSVPNQQNFRQGIALKFFPSLRHEEYGFIDEAMTASDHVRFQVGLLARFAPLLALSGLAALLCSAFFFAAGAVERRAPDRKSLLLLLRSLGAIAIAPTLMLVAISTFMFGVWTGTALLVVFAIVCVACKKITSRRLKLPTLVKH